MLFEIGQPVWARIPRKGELPCVVTGDAGSCDEHPDTRVYLLDSYPSASCGSLLRPRRDDYQQREGTGDISSILKPACQVI